MSSMSIPFSSVNDWLCRGVLTVGLMGFYLGTSPAHAQESPGLDDLIEVECIGTQKQTWSPGLKLQVQTGTYHNETQYDCGTAIPGLVSASFSVTTTYEHGCTLDPSAGTVTLEWNDGTLSKYVFNAASVDVGGTGQVYVSTGTVFSGRFFGDEVLVINPSLDASQLLACLSPTGLTHLEGTSILKFIKLR
jgi:hypothetical protein